MEVTLSGIMIPPVIEHLLKAFSGNEVMVGSMVITPEQQLVDGLLLQRQFWVTVTEFGLRVDCDGAIVGIHVGFVEGFFVGVE